MRVVVLLPCRRSSIPVTDLDEGYEGYGDLGVGAASVSLYPRAVTKEEKAQWALEDAARDARRGPIGFSAPAQESAQPLPVSQPRARAGKHAASTPRAPRRSRPV